MKPINVYLGWENPRKAYAFREHNILVLMKGTESRVLQGQAGQDHIRFFSAICNHLCGVGSSSVVTKWIADSPKTENGPYDAFFDSSWERGT